MYRPANLGVSIDPWLAQEPDSSRRETVLLWLQDMMQSPLNVPDAKPVPGYHSPAFTASVPEAHLGVSWVVIDQYKVVAFPAVRDFLTGLTWNRFGPKPTP